MSQSFQPTPEQIALAQERKLKKAQKRKEAEEQAAREEQLRAQILPRPWITSQAAPAANGQKFRVMTWNLLAQCLVRRTLFPTSDCLKASEREHMMYREILSHQADICCLQEVDRLEKLLPVLDDAGYSWVYAAGPRKKHGCLIAYRKESYQLVRDKKILYDEQDVRESESETGRRGSSFRTKNIASLVALRRLDVANTGVVVATTHLFWHPSYTYERARQAAILLREVSKFRDQDVETRSWPCIIAGDFNFQPDDPAYAFLVGDALLPEQEMRLEASRVVHISVDPDVPITSSTANDDEEGGETTAESDADKTIANARWALPSDGLLTSPELFRIYKAAGVAKSVYDEGLRARSDASDKDLTFGSRVVVAPDRKGAYEPIWTSYTHYWKSVLDYIFVLEPPGHAMSVVGLAKLHPTSSLGEGLPRMGVCGSDHISLAADLSWTSE